MIAMMTALLLSSSTVPATDLAANALPQLFEAACLDGEARLPAGSASAVSFDALPREVRTSLAKPSSAQVWQLNGAGHAFLYMLQYEPGGSTSPRICGIASDEMNFAEAVNAVEMRVTGAMHPRTTLSTEWLNLDSGYDALATKAGDFNVLQINWLSDAARRDLIRARPAIP